MFNHQTMSPRVPSLLLGLWLVVQVAVPLARLDRAKVAPFSSRFSWSMFAGRPLARCTHTLVWRDVRGSASAMPLPPPGPVRDVLTARSEEDFTRVVPLLTAYASDDDEVIGALHDLLRRHRAMTDPDAIVESVLDCQAWDGRRFQRVLRLGGPR